MDILLLSTDELHLNLRRLFLQDMRDMLSDPSFFLLEEADPRGQQELNYLCSPKRFKARYQANNYLKRYIMTGEGENLEGATAQKFFDVQLRIGHKMPMSYRASEVCRLARRYVKDVLGNDPYKHPELFRWGKRACIGVPYRESYLHSRINTLTGSPAHIRWFQKFRLDDGLLNRVLPDQYIETNRLVADFVPKKWNILRLIMKNTNIGSFYTAGLGDTIVHLWKEYGYDLHSRAERHRVRVKKYSQDRSYVTADLSSASDCFTPELVKRLVPYSWYKALNLGRIRYATVHDMNNCQMQSFMTMGIGFTFPLQSLLFYSIIRATMELVGFRDFRGISVFGDDLIYPTKAHAYVSTILADLGFTLNSEKTYDHAEFRESCGADFYVGVDVRPYQPEGTHTLCTGVDAQAYLYKVYNGWCRRWRPWEIPRVCSYLESRLALYGKIHQVPPDFPDTAGVKWGIPIDHPLYEIPIRNSNGSLVVRYLRNKVPRTEVQDPRIYYWNTLRKGGKEEPVVSWDSGDDPVCSYFPTPKSIKCRELWIASMKRPDVLHKRYARDSRNDECIRLFVGDIPPLKLKCFVGSKGVPHRYISQQSVTPHWDYPCRMGSSS